ncbi:MAG TPA: tRNA uridine-5-carboxymethylaminomethyl(34) synthesis enzyme MnmG [Cyanobacteria bacterium UBA8530]|nr:tRNA uridine-5-carboxymethylaminomethyl(34) synthesis enzyme MnmG [Cyanobacteria bacterium UBA8530]
MRDSLWDVLVIGGGHAGCEAALAAARLGARTLLLTMNLDTIAWMPCNPAIGGPAKGNLVREVDALGGEMGRAADDTAIQIKLLNLSKGPAVQALRSQNDKKGYSARMRQALESERKLFLRQGMAEAIEPISGGFVVIDSLGNRTRTISLVLCAGTFLRGKVHVGFSHFSAGRAGEFSAEALTGSLLKMGFETGRLKTGTPPRVDGRTIDFSKLEPSPGDEKKRFFSFLPPHPERPHVPCFLAYTNVLTHQVILKNLDRSPLFAGRIEGIGPRYCPSIEDKVVRFSEKERHPLFVEPEGLDSCEKYLQGLSTSLPVDVQLEMLRTIPGFEEVEITRPGYAVEYDYFPATQLDSTLQSKLHFGFFFAGQVNGTSGYEEAAAQGIAAGINAARHALSLPLVVFSRAQSYLGTLIDDLVTKEIRDPYRMLTSRSEYRLVLRHGNADRRLTPLGQEIGLVGKERWRHFSEKEESIRSELRWLNERADPDRVEKVLGIGKDRSFSWKDLLRRPEVSYPLLLEAGGREGLSEEVSEEVSTEVKYQGYIERQGTQIERLSRLEGKAIPEDLDFSKIEGLSSESKDKLARIIPRSIGQASRIGGVTPADVSLLLVHLETRKRRVQKEEL